MARAKRTKRKRSRSADAGGGRKRDAAFVSELREALTLAGTAGVISAPVTHSHLLEMIVQTASHVIRARAASLCLVDDSGQELVFEVVQGEKAEELRKIHVPIGHGIVGLVAQTAEPIAISDASSDPRHASEFGARVGYIPRSIVAVPLLYEDRVVGVLELLDKEGGPSFDANDIEALGLFANLAAIAIQQSRAHTSLALMLMDAIWSLGDLPADRRLKLSDGARSFATDLQGATYGRALELAELVREIVHSGPRPASACRTILEAFADYVRQRPSVPPSLAAIRRGFP
jgi:putative methionine-R-sulfoxide reductase with GAF domain